ncbi:MAG: flotillin family protein [Myxococcales bacterium]|nr:flotillin family protein [Myxococcales bacterium]
MTRERNADEDVESLARPEEVTDEYAEEDDDVEAYELARRAHRVLLIAFGGALALATAGVGVALALGDMIAAATAGVLATAALGYLIVYATLVELVPPGRVLVLSGRLDQSTGRSYRMLARGHAFRAPLREQAELLDCRARTITVSVDNAYSRGSVALALELRARVRLARAEPTVHHAIERFLGQRLQEVEVVASQTLEGHARMVVADCTLETLRADPARFAARVLEEAEDDFRRLGIELESMTLERARP